MASGAAATSERFRAIRRELEDGILPLATSIDGRRFTFQTALNGLAFGPGGYVALQTPRGIAVGQVLAVPEGALAALATEHGVRLAGKLSPTPALLRFDTRLSVEGGGDVPATWAQHG